MTDTHERYARDDLANPEPTEKPSLGGVMSLLEKAIAIVGTFIEEHTPGDITTVTATDIRILRRLVEAAEFEQRWQSEYLDTPKMLAEKNRQLQTLRTQLDSLGKESAAKDQRIEELESKGQLRIEERDYCSAALNDGIKQMDKLRAQLAEKEGELERLREKEKHWDGKDKDESVWYRRTCEAWLENDELKKRLDAVLEESTPAPTEMNWTEKFLLARIEDSEHKHIALREQHQMLAQIITEKFKIWGNFPGKLGIVEKKLDILAEKNPGCFDDSAPSNPSRAPTEAEVERVVVELRAVRNKVDCPPASEALPHEILVRKIDEAVARHVIERGYRADKADPFERTKDSWGVPPKELDKLLEE